ncbi:hypothetical protein L0337_38400 [candidate division KSB1 bacterium]|nr:hypothetical protein [candidate division KSB1 bacterium]
MRSKYLQSSLGFDGESTPNQFRAASRYLMLCCFLAVVAISLPALHAAPQQNRAAAVPQIEHFSPTAGVVGSPIAIEARLMTPGRSVVYLRLYFKSIKEQAFKFVDMRPGAQGYAGQIPGRAVRSPAVQYFLVALLSDQTVVSHPARNPYGQPFEVLIRENAEGSVESEQAPKAGTEIKAQPKSSAQPEAKPPLEVSPQLLDKIEKLERPMAEASEADSSAAFEVSLGASQIEPTSSILILSPEPFSVVAAKEVVIAASFMTETLIDSTSIKILFDGINVTRKAEISPAIVSFTPATIAPGEHTVTITARDQLGSAVGPQSWRFEVSGKTEKIAATNSTRRATGVVYAETRREKFSGRSLNNTNIGADLSGNTGPLLYSASAYFTSLEDKTLQPRHRFVINAGLPWLNFTLGDATPYYDELILWGRRVRGFEAGLNTGWVNLHFITGETVRQVDPFYVAVPNPLDSTQLITQRQRFGTFKQSLLGLRPSFGSLAKRGFLWGFTVVKVRDDKDSLPTDSTNVVQFGRVTPRDNLVLGTDLNLALDRRRFTIKASGAWSLLSNDISSGTILQDSLQKIADVDLPFNPQDFNSWFILNESTSPLDPRGKTSLAYQFTLHFNYFNQFLSAGYKRLGSEYVSLGHSFLRNDIRGFFINNRCRLLRNRAFLTLGFERYNDHFNNLDGRPQTDLNTWQLGLAVFWDPNLPSLNFNFRNHSRDNGVDPTTVTNFAQEDNATRDLSISLNYDVTAFNFDHTLTFSLTNSDRVDNVERVPGAVTGDAASNLKSISVRTRYQKPITSTITFATNDNDVAGGQSLFKYNMFSGRVDYDFSQQRTESRSFLNNFSNENRDLQLRTYAAFNTVSASGRTNPAAIAAGAINVIDYNQTGFQLGGSLQFRQQHEFVLDLSLLNYKDRGGVQTTDATTGALLFVTNPSFKNSLLRAYYSFRF